MGAQFKTPHIADRYDTLTRELILTANNAAKRELSECGDDYRKRWQYILEQLHERYVEIDASDIGALTDAPLLADADDTWLNGDGKREFAKNNCRIYYFANYALIDETEELRTKGVVRFNMVRTA